MRSTWGAFIAFGLGLGLAFALAGCLQSPLVPCGETVCPSGYKCTLGGCATPADVDACQGRIDGDSCRTANDSPGICQGGACRTGLCGNGTLDVGEQCDDMNLDSGDGCRGDCLKIEMCGDGERDEGEACDDGNDNAADGCDVCKLTTWSAKSIVGSPVDATTIALANPSGIAVDGRGRIYVADTNNHRIRRIEEDGSFTTIAGTGIAGYAGDGGAATSAQLNLPGGVALDGIGRVFVSDTANHRLRRIDVDGTIILVAGTGEAGHSGDGELASLAQLWNPNGVVVDGLGRVFVADTGSHVIRRIDIDGTISTVAGIPGGVGGTGDGGPAASALLASPYAVAIDALGRIVIADTSNQRVRRIELDGTIVTIAGTGEAGYNGDGIPATSAKLASPVALGVDPQGRIVFSDAFNRRVRRVELDGTISTIAGTGTEGYSGDGAAATAAQLGLPVGVAVDTQGRVAIADAVNQRIRQVAANGSIATVGGTGTFGFAGDGTVATSAALSGPFSVVVDPQGRIYITDAFHFSVRRIELDGSITTIAGTGISGDRGDGGPATAAQLSTANGLAIDAQGRLYIADAFNHRIRRVDTSGVITTIAGTGQSGSTGDGGPATSAYLANPNGVAIDAQGRVLIADTYNSKIRRIETDGTINTVAGTGTPGYDGDGVQATSTRLAFPYEVKLDPLGRILISDTANQRLRRIALDGTITTIAGTGVRGYSGDGGLALSAQIDGPQGIELDSLGRIVFVDGGNHLVRRIELDGTLVTLAGAGTQDGARGDGGPASGALLWNPHGVALDAMGRVIVADKNNDRVRRFDATTMTTIAGRIDPETAGPVATARLADPQAIAVVTPALTLVAAGASCTLEAIRGERVEVVAGRYPQESPTGALARYRTEEFGTVGGTAVDPARNLIYLAETSENRLHVITQTDPGDPRTWTIAVLANAAGTAGFADGAASTAQFRSPSGLFFDATERILYIADTGNHAIRALDLDTNIVTTIANLGHSLGFGGDGGPAAAARLYRPTAVTRCTNGDLFIADTGNNRVRRIAPGSGTITTVLGDGVPASSGEGAPARTFPVDGPRGLACDAFGNLFATSTSTVRLLTANDSGIVDGSGAVQTIYGTRDEFPNSVTGCLTALAVTDGSTVQIADACTGLLIELTRSHQP